MKQTLRCGAEFDVIFGKKYYCYLQRPGVSSKIKRGMRRRLRHELNQNTRHEFIEAITRVA
jgi:hypothetical protein